MRPTVSTGGYRSLAVCESVGQGGGRQGARPSYAIASASPKPICAASNAVSARAIGGRTLPRVSPDARIASLAQACRDRGASTAIALGEHREQGSQGVGHVIRRGIGGTRYDQYHARKDAARPRGARRSRAGWPRTAEMRKSCSQASPKPGIDIDALAIQSQREGAQAFVKSWQELMTDRRQGRRARACRLALRLPAEMPNSAPLWRYRRLRRYRQ